MLDAGKSHLNCSVAYTANAYDSVWRQVMTCLSKHTNHEETESSQACHCRGTIPIRCITSFQSFKKLLWNKVTESRSRDPFHFRSPCFHFQGYFKIAFICTLAVLWNQSVVLNFKYQVLGWQQWCFFQNVSFRNYSKLVSGVFWLVINTSILLNCLQFSKPTVRWKEDFS